MTRHTLTILEELRLAVERSVLRDECEYPAILLCGRSSHIDPWTGEREERFLAREFVEVDQCMIQERTETGMTWSTTPFYNSLKRASSKDLAVAVVHSHPRGPLSFSPADDIAERELFQIAFNRLDSRRPHLSIVMDGEGNLVARAYYENLKPESVDLIRIVGNRWKYLASDLCGGYQSPHELDRQMRAFGRESTAILGRLRIGIVGCGGTGSAMAMLLARIGVQRMVLFDADRVEDTNLNRLHFSTRIDANLRRLKVDVVGEGVANIGLPISIVRVPHEADTAQCRDALRSCDIVFGCTDDHLGRNVLNRLAHFYIIPVVDVGLLIEPNDRGGYDAFDGRVTVVQPGYTCQVCRGLISSERMLAEDMRRNDPDLYGERRRAGYVPNNPDPSPAVVTFTTELATMAINELFQRLNGFRGPVGSCAERVRKFDEIKDADSVPGGKSRPACKLCGSRKYDGRGDMTPFLDQV